MALTTDGAAVFDLQCSIKTLTGSASLISRSSYVFDLVLCPLCGRTRLADFWHSSDDGVRRRQLYVGFEIGHNQGVPRLELYASLSAAGGDGKTRVS
jgi:hypothetical protein